MMAGEMTPSVIAVFTVSVSEPACTTACPLPFVDVDGKYCFTVTVMEQNFTDSIDLCQQLGGFLARIDTAEKNASFVQYVECKFYS